MLCAANGHVHALETLIRCKADITMKDVEGQDALSLTQAKSLETHFHAMNQVVELAETSAYETDEHDQDDLSPTAPTSPSGGKVAPELLDALAQRDPTLALILSAKDGYADCFLDLINQGAKVNYADVNGQTPLHCYASVPGVTPNGVDILARAGTDIDRQDDLGCTPLMCAVGVRNVTIMKALVEHGANRAIKNAKKETALDLAKKMAESGDAVSAEELDLLRPPNFSSPCAV
jgi:ankyrin repeat protein